MIKHARYPMNHSPLDTPKKILWGLKNIADFAVLMAALVKASEWLAEVSKIPWPVAVVFVLVFVLILAYFVWAVKDWLW